MYYLAVVMIIFSSPPAHQPLSGSMAQFGPFPSQQECLKQRQSLSVTFSNTQISVNAGCFQAAEPAKDTAAEPKAPAMAPKDPAVAPKEPAAAPKDPAGK